MSDNNSDAVRELRRALYEQQRTIFILRSQVIDQRAVVLQNLTRIESIEGYMTNNRGERFRPRFSPIAGVELGQLGRRLEMRERRRQNQADGTGNNAAGSSAIGRNEREDGPSSDSAPGTSGNLPPTPLSSRTAATSVQQNDTLGDGQGTSQNGDAAENGPGPSGILEAHMNRARVRMVRDEMVHRALQQQIEHQHQYLLQQQQREQAARQQHIREQLDEADQLHEQILEAENDENQDPAEQQQQQQRQIMQQQLYERNVRLQLREGRRFSSGAASSLVVPPAQLYWERECLICTELPANFYNRGCGHVCLCSACAVNCVLHKIATCILCRAPVNGTYAFVR
ncbi:hypothetical protein niasHT_006385 [Heterodera trifolii]|uniref:RING-type domain-containing protein n=1 Tax=Heterodera trifolii TaxID=157864 RepID=A0ABD2LQW3_9BILA